MPRSRGPRKLSRDELLILVKQHLERTGSHGLTREDLVAAIGPTNTSLALIQRGAPPHPETMRASIRDAFSRQKPM